MLSDNKILLKHLLELNVVVGLKFLGIEFLILFQTLSKLPNFFRLLFFKLYSACV